VCVVWCVCVCVVLCCVVLCCVVLCSVGLFANSRQSILFSCRAKVYNSGKGISYGSRYDVGDTVGVVVNFPKKTIEFFRNGTSQVCCVVLRCVALRYVVLCYVVLCCVVLCCVVLCCVVLCCVMLCCVMLRCVALRYVVLCYVVLCCVVLRRVLATNGVLRSCVTYCRE